MKIELFLLLGIIVIIPQAYATLEIYNAELNCPIESLDLTGALLEFEYIEMCEIIGPIIVPSGSGGGYGGISNATGVIDQLKELTANYNYNIKELLENEIDNRLELEEEIDDLKKKIDKIINQLFQNIKKADTMGITDMVTREEVEKIIRDSLNAQFIIPAYANHSINEDNPRPIEPEPEPDTNYSPELQERLLQNEQQKIKKVLEIPNSYKFQDEIKENLKLTLDYRKTLAENAKLERTFERLDQASEILQRLFVDTEVAIKLFLTGKN